MIMSAYAQRERARERFWEEGERKLVRVWEGGDGMKNVDYGWRAELRIWQPCGPRMTRDAEYAGTM